MRGQVLCLWFSYSKDVLKIVISSEIAEILCQNCVTLSHIKINSICLFSY